MRLHPWLLLASLLLAATSSEGEPLGPIVDTTGRGGVTTSTRVPVFVYNAIADLSGDDEQVALAVAAATLSTASVAVDWTSCKPGACLTAAPAALRVRFVVSPDTQRRDPGVLGHAFIDPQTRSGVLASVFVDRTRRLASGLSIDYRVLLGRAIAHELGHLLLGTVTHGSAGLMREAWSHDELLGARRGDWIFTSPDAAAIRARLAGAHEREPRGAS